MKSVIKLGMVTLVALASGGASAGLVTEYDFGATVGKNAASVSLGASIAADAGDVIVFTATSSQAYVKGYSVTSGDAGVVSAESGVWLDKNATVSYFKVTTGGTFDLSVAGNDQTFDTFGAYVIGSDQVGYGVAELTSETGYVGANVNVMNVLDYGTLANAGIVVGAAQSAGFISYPTGLSVFDNGAAASRASLWGAVSAGALSQEFISSDITKNQRAVGMVFTEVIPEPATFGLVALFGSSILFIRRRAMM